MESIILKVAFSPPPSLFLNALSLINLPSFALNGFSESRGQNLQYSKFWHVGNNNNNNGDNNSSNGYNSEKYSKKLGQRKVGSRRGMLICYTPAFLASAALFFVFPHENNLRLLLLNSALALHFFKRIFEVLYVHKYSGNMVLKTAIIISLSYLTSTTTMIYAQHLSQGLAEPQIDLKYIGLFMFLIGITGNFYHHYLLSQLRKKGDEKYKIPKWGLFGQVICPHYLFEIIEFVGFSFISQTLHSFSVALGTMFYLVGRSFATRQWYLSKFEDFPKNVKALIPYIF
ncbi:3-oxo-5-alpha-steroid 4-dehydrogenase 2 [Morus notabilis]|uniref:3-oxo-5-alpha-steroid 4-dehydrogenase 2 n=1 Tax=Morus notabilis TaxID=981085 RepID=W9RVF2_9ROSA|nr:3-oxo-5-alpha-steroid 4-dehydrogenase 2 [Morus notabilis]EXB97677.1 3-oxo-5-alpha-steroid 4-dehydrogenase 2 [Morus notabilis]